MTMRNILFASACLLAACSPPASQHQSANGAPPAPGATQVNPVGAALQPGQYRTTVTIVSMNMPGMPAGMAEKMRAQPNVSEDCMTTDDVAELTRKSLVNEDSGQHCTENSINSANGRINGTATCNNGDGGSYTMQMHGTYGSNHVEMDMTMSGQTPMGPMQQQMHMVTDRIGECHGTSTN
ncbi:MAG: DUF3617 domain-containing protein [Vitreimonas sp.]